MLLPFAGHSSLCAVCFSLPLMALLMGACGHSGSGSILDSGSPGFGTGDAAGELDAGSPLDASLEEGGKTTAASCFSDVPCESEAQCVTLPGTACDPVSRRCHRLDCSPAGEPCGRTAFCQRGLACNGDDWTSGGAFERGTCKSVDAVRAACSRGCNSLASVSCSPEERDAICKQVCNSFPWDGPEFSQSTAECAEDARVDALECRGSAARSCSVRLRTPCGRSIWTDFKLAKCP